MKKKITCLACLLLVFALATSVFAASSVEVTLEAGSTNASSGDEITIDVSAVVDSCGSGGIEVSFDTKVFELVSGKWVLEGTFMDDFSTSSKDGVFALDSDSPIQGNVFTMVLKVKDGAALGKSSVSVTFIADKTSVKKSVSITVSCRHSYTNGCDTTCDLCGATREASHSWDSGKVTKDATCTKAGEITYTCTVCSKTKTESGKTIDHTYDSGEVTKEATCTKEGEKTYTCTVCSKTKTETVAATGHDYGSGEVTTEPTCTEEGVKTYTCKVCGKTKTKSVESNGHSYDDGQVEVEATCTEEGKTVYTCTVCGKTKSKTIEMVAHQYDHDCDTDCNVCGTEREITHDLIWTGDEYEHWEQCSVCGYSLPGAEHSLESEQSWTNTVHGYLCTVCGLYPQSEEHQLDNDCDTDCASCGYSRSIMHNYSTKWSYNAEGHWYECTICGDQLEMELHEPGAEATETTDQICTVCGYIIQVAGNHEHTMAGDWLSDENGHWFQCICSEYTQAVQHGWDSGTIDEENLTVTYTCSDCGYTKIETYVPPTEPAVTEPDPNTEPTEASDPTDPMKDPDWLDFDFSFNFAFENFKLELWMILAVCLALSVILNIILIVAVAAKKKPGKFDRLQPAEEEEPSAEENLAPRQPAEEPQPQPEESNDE